MVKVGLGQVRLPLQYFNLFWDFITEEAILKETKYKRIELFQVNTTW
jgi:hypothetical protein